VSIARVRCWARRGDSTSFEPYKDREVHHGEEDKREETVHQKEEEGRSGSQEAQDSQGIREKVDQEEIGAQGRPEASLGAEARGSFNARSRTDADALVEPAQRLRRRGRFRHLTSIEQARRAAASSVPIRKFALICRHALMRTSESKGTLEK
jgi:hypothetical protein